MLIGRETPRASIAYAAVSCAEVAAILSIHLATARAGRPIDVVWLSAYSAGIATLYQALSLWLWRVADRREVDLGQSSRTKPYPLPLFHLGLILSGFAAVSLARFLVDHHESLATTDLVGIAVTMTLTAISVAIASIRRGEASLPHGAVLTGGCGAVAWALAAASWRGVPSSPIGLGLACGGVSLALAGLGDRVRGRAEGWVRGYRDPLLVATFLAVLCGWSFGGLA